MSKRELIKKTLHISSIGEGMREWELSELAEGITVHEYKSGTHLLQPDKSIDMGCLIIIASGEAEIYAPIDNKPTLVRHLNAGDLAGIFTFVGGLASQINVTIIAKTDCKVLLLDRAFLENLIAKQPAIVYFVMQGIVRYLHGVVRNLNAETANMENYIYKTQARG